MKSLIIAAFISFLLMCLFPLGVPIVAIFGFDPGPPDWRVIFWMWAFLTVLWWIVVEGLRNSVNGTGPYAPKNKDKDPK